MTGPVTGTARQQTDERRESRLVTAVVTEGFVNRLGFGIVTFALPLYALQLGMGIAEIGLLVATKALLQPAIKPLVGIAVDRWGARRGYLAAVWFRFFASIALLFAATPAALFGVRLLQGLASAAQDPVSISVLAKGRSERAGRRFSAVYAARDVGKVAAGAVGGFLLALTGSFTALWWLVVALAAVPLAIVWFFVHELPDRPGGADPEDVPEEYQRILRSPRLRAIAMLGLFGGLTATMTHALFQVYAAEVAGLSAAQIGVVYSISVAALLVVGPLAGWVGDRHGHGVLASARGTANAVSSIVLIVFPSFGGMLAGRLVDEGGKAAFRPTWGSLLAHSSRRAGRRGGRTAAGLDAWLSVGEALGPLVAGLIWDLAGAVWFLVVRAVLGVGVELVLGRRLRAALQEAAAPEPSPPRPLVVGAGRTEVRAAGLAGFSGPVTVVAGPGDRIRVRGGPEGARALAGALSEGLEGDEVLVDGQRLVRGMSPTCRPGALIPAASPASALTVAEALRRDCPQAAPEDLALACRRAGLASPASLTALLGSTVGGLPPEDRERLGLAMALVGDPLVLVVDGDTAWRVHPELLEGHRGAVVTVEPVGRPLMVSSAAGCSPTGV